MKVLESFFSNKESIPQGVSVLLGISINNSYFNEENLKHLVKWARQSRGAFFMIPDEPSVFTMMAKGASKSEAEKTCRLKANNLENKCRRAIAFHGAGDVPIVRWNDLHGSLPYLESLVEIAHAYKQEAEFRDAVTKATLAVIGEENASRAELGVQFLLKELAFIGRADLILKQEKVAYVYHKTMPILCDLIAGKYSFKASQGVGLITLV